MTGLTLLKLVQPENTQGAMLVTPLGTVTLLKLLQEANAPLPMLVTTLGRLQEASGAAIVFCYAERLPLSEGFHLHLTPLDGALPADRREAARRVNAMVEELVRACPAQYLWGYNRYKQPAGAPPPPPHRQLA